MTSHGLIWLDYGKRHITTQEQAKLAYDYWQGPPLGLESAVPGPGSRGTCFAGQSSGLQPKYVETQQILLCSKHLFALCVVFGDGQFLYCTNQINSAVTRHCPLDFNEMSQLSRPIWICAEIGSRSANLLKKACK